MAAAVPLSEADLHGIVDGRLDPTRRGDVMRRLAASPADRAKVDAWQEQNHLIRSAFFGVDKEPLPTGLKLTPPPNLHCVPAALDIHETSKTPRRRDGMLVSIATMMLLGLGIGATLFLVQSPEDNTRQIVDLRLRGTVDEVLANQVAGAVDTDSARSPKPRLAQDILPDALPTATIPDLTSAGFSFTSAETQASSPNSLVFHYRNAAADRIAVSVAHAPMTSDMGVTKIGRSFAWHRGETAFAIAGTIRPDRLRAMADVLQSNFDE